MKGEIWNFMNFGGSKTVLASGGMQVFLILLVAVATNILQFIVVRNGSRSTYEECQRVSSGPSCGSRLSYNHIINSYQKALETNFDVHGYIISGVEEKYNFSRASLEALNITAHRYVPPPYKSSEVDIAMEEYNHGSRMFHNETRFLKMFSNRLAHTNLLHMFVNDETAKMNSWRFFFEDDIALSPNVTHAQAAEALVKGMELANADGKLYLGICGPVRVSKKKVEVVPGVEASNSYGACTHAYGVTKWRAAGILSHLDKLESKEVFRLFYDQTLKNYGMQVTATWVLGSNFKTPIPEIADHVGLIYQDRVRYGSFVLAPPGLEDGEANTNGTLT